MPTTNADDSTTPVTAESLKPSDCNGITLTAIVTGAGNVDGSDASELILGSGGVDDIDGKKGDDCILGGGGDDSLKGSQGTDVCIGGPGNDSFHNSCETQIQ